MYGITFEPLFEHSSLGIIISNEHGIIEKANPYAAKIFGYGPDELTGQVIEVLLPENIREKHVKYREQYNKNPLPRAMGSNLNLSALKKNGEEFPVEISLSYYVDQGKIRIVSFVNDITIRKKAEEKLLKFTEELEQKVKERTKELSDALIELSHTNDGLQLEMEQRKKAEAQIRDMYEKEKELNELKSRFVSMASHEFRTPLGGILSSISLIARYEKPEDAPKREKHVNTIKSLVKNLTNILNDFLSLDKLEHGKVTTALSEFDFVKLLNDLIEELRDTAKQKIFLENQVAVINMIQDKEIIRNVLINLLSNAIKYSPENTQITTRVELLDHKVKVEIIDQGMGIPQEDQKHLFERFFRAKNVSTLQGTGLGLNIVKRYVELVGGEISFTSIENKGTTFQVVFPLEKV